jgi:hypothetical protein
LKNPPAIYADLPYGTKREPKQTPDVVLRYPRALVVAEVVSGPLQSATITHGDLDAFGSDMRKLIEKKARQLTRRVDEILGGDTRVLGLHADGISAIWPVIISATTFPHRPEIGPVVRQRLKREGLLGHRLFRPLSIISAEELAAAEGAMEDGTPFIDLLTEWKRTAATGDHPLRNHLIFRERDQRRRPAQHHLKMYHEASKGMIGEVLEADEIEEALYREDSESE